MYLSPWIYTTNNCNLRCPYCFVENQSDIMSEDVWLAIVEYFINALNTKQLKETVFRLSGGEPLLVFDTWYEFIPYMRKMINGSHKFHTVVLSNFTLFNERIARFALENEISFSVSLDGTRHSKIDVNGESTAKLVMEKLRFANYCGLHTTVSTVLNDSNIGTGEILELARFVCSHNFDWLVDSDIYGVHGMEKYEQMYTDMTEAIDYLIKSGYPMQKFTFNFLNRKCMCGGCAAGSELFSISTNGDIYPCQTCKGKPLANIQNCDNIIGTLHNQKLYNVGFNYKLPDVCHPDHCPASMLCYGSCKLNMNPSEDNPKCRLIRRLYQYLDSKEYFVGQVVN